MKCNLSADINSCPFYDRKIEGCSNERSCSFQYEDKIVQPYIRGERWYEKYTDPVKRDKHRRIWQWYSPTNDEFDELFRGVLTEIEEIPDLPSDFEITNIDYMFGLDIQIDFKNAGRFSTKIQKILERLKAGSWII